MNNRSTKILMLFAMVAAVVLSVSLAISLARDRKDLDVMKNDLTVSRNHWESIAAEKETLLDEYKQVSNDLREANLTYEEETAKIVKYTTEIDSLRKDIEALKVAISDAQ